MVGVEPGFPFAVADLLAPVGLHTRAVVMPDQCRRREPDPQPPGLQPPADVHVVARAEVDRVEAVDREQRVPAKRHVAARHVLCVRSSSITCVGPPGARATHWATQESSGGTTLGPPAPTTSETSIGWTR